MTTENKENQQGQSTPPGNQNPDTKTTQENTSFLKNKQDNPDYPGTHPKENPQKEAPQKETGGKEHDDSEHPHQHKPPVLEPGNNNYGQSTERKIPVEEDPNHAIMEKHPVIDPVR